MISSTNCVMTHHGLMVDRMGTISPCCVYAAGDYPSDIPYHDHERYNQEIQQVMIDDFEKDRPHAACAKCYRTESLQGSSLRLYYNHAYGNDRVLMGKGPVYHLELRLGNICNLKCMMCWPGASTALASERWLHKEKFASIKLQVEDLQNIDPWWRTDRFRAWYLTLIPQLRYIHFTGGEPFMIPEVIDFLKLAWPYRHSLALGFNTNLTLAPDSMIDLLKDWPKVQVSVSLEGVSHMNDYVRYPSDWSIIHSNLLRIKSCVPRARIAVNHTVQHASAYSLPALADYCQDHDLPLVLSLVEGSPDLSWNSVPPRDLVKLQAWIDNSTTITDMNRHFLRNLMNITHFDHDCYHRFRRYVEVLDEIRHTSWDQTFEPSVVDTA